MLALDILLISQALFAILVSLLTIHRFWCILETDVRPEGRACSAHGWDANIPQAALIERILEGRPGTDQFSEKPDRF